MVAAAGKVVVMVWTQGQSGVGEGGWKLLEAAISRSLEGAMRDVTGGWTLT